MYSCSLYLYILLRNKAPRKNIFNECFTLYNYIWNRIRIKSEPAYNRLLVRRTWHLHLKLKLCDYYQANFFRGNIALYTAHKKFMNTSFSAESMASFTLEGRYLENQTPSAVEILHDFKPYGPLTDLCMVWNNTGKLPLESFHNTTA